MAELLPDITTSMKQPLVYHHKNRTFIKYARPITKLLSGVCDKIKNYGVVSQKFWEEHNGKILKSFEVDMEIAIEEKRKYGQTFLRVLNQDMIAKSNMPMVPIYSVNYSCYVQTTSEYWFIIHWMRDFFKKNNHILQKHKNRLKHLFLDPSQRTTTLYAYKINIPEIFFDIALEKNSLIMMRNKNDYAMVIMKDEKRLKLQKALIQFMNEEYPEKEYNFCNYYLHEWSFIGMLVEKNIIKSRYDKKDKEMVDNFIQSYFVKDDCGSWRWRSPSD